VSAAGATGPAPEGKNYRAVTAQPADQQKPRTELELEGGAATLARRHARIFGSPTKNNCTAPAIPFPSGETIDTGITAPAATPKQSQAEASKHETLPGEQSEPNASQAKQNGTSTPLTRGPEACIEFQLERASTATIGATISSGDRREKASDQIATFMERVVAWPGPRPGYVNLHYPSNDPKFKSMPGKPFTKVSDFMNYVDFAVRTFNAVYFCLSTQSQTKTYKNGKVGAVRRAENAVALKSIWLDVDVKDDPKHYGTFDEALYALAKFREASLLPPPSALVFSGGGMHVYWISEKALTVQEWKPYAEGLRQKAVEFGLKCDAGLTTDAARVLRVPGTLNKKEAQPRPVKLTHLGDDYDFRADLACLVTAATAATMTVTAAVTGPEGQFDLTGWPPPCAGFPDPQSDSLAAGLGSETDLLLDPTEVFKRCLHYRESLRHGGKNHGQGLWMQTVLGATWFESGREIAHALSDKYPTYTREETDAMLDRKLKDRAERGLGWPGCKAFESEGANCRSCPFYGKIRSPLSLASRTAPPAPELVAAQVEGQHTPPVATIRALHKGGASKETLFAALNETYAVVRYGSEVLIASIIGRDVLTMKPEDFYKMFGNVRLWDGERDVEVSRLWLKWKDRRQYLGRGVVFQPGGPLDITDDMLNLWRGFGIEPKQGDWSLTNSHIFNVVCSGQQRHFDYLIRWMAYGVQHPEEPIGVAIALRGAQGAGKGFVARTYGKFYGRHFAHIANGEQLTGRFNASLATSCAVFLDEALWAGDRKGEGVLKALITEPRLQLEAKFRDPIMVDNRLRIMVASNNDWCVPAGIGDRRWFILDVANTFAGTMHRGYWDALYAEIENGGAAAMFHDLLAMDLSGFDVRAVPHTAAKAQQQAHSLHGTEAWLYHVLQEGCIGLQLWQDTGLAVSKEIAYRYFEEFSKQQRSWRLEIKDLWSKKIRAALGQCVADTRPNRVRSFQFAPLADCRRQFETHAGAPNIEWEAEADPDLLRPLGEPPDDASGLSEPCNARRQPVGKLESRPAIPEVFQKGH
jgi:hypothetical protein